MAEPHQKLAASLNQLKALRGDALGGRRVFQSRELGRVHRERLLRNGFLCEIMKGWVLSATPGTGEGDSTPWYAAFWEFCDRYCHERFGSDWHLSPEQSLLLYAEATAIPAQVVVYSPRGTNNSLPLPFDTSIYDLKQKDMPASGDVVELHGLRIYAPPVALTRVPQSFYRRHPVEAQVVLSHISDSVDVLRPLLAGGHSAVAGRLVGAFRRIGSGDIADDIASTMRAAGYTVRETDPFEPDQNLADIVSSASPIVGRLQALWETHRDTVIAAFPPPPGWSDPQSYLRMVDGIYQSDAYHSLSIEGYRVSQELIERVRSGAWDPEHHEADRGSRDALAARGYWQAFRIVKEDAAKVIAGENPGKLVSKSHRNWYRELFQPCVAAGLADATALAGYRSEAVFLRGSRHVPPRWEVMREAMPAFFDLLTREDEPSVRAVLGHWLFGYLHPYPDGNGRMAGFLACQVEGLRPARG